MSDSKISQAMTSLWTELHEEVRLLLVERFPGESFSVPNDFNQEVTWRSGVTDDDGNEIRLTLKCGQESRFQGFIHETGNFRGPYDRRGTTFIAHFTAEYLAASLGNMIGGFLDFPSTATS